MDYSKFASLWWGEFNFNVWLTLIFVWNRSLLNLRAVRSQIGITFLRIQNIKIRQGFKRNHPWFSIAALALTCPSFYQIWEASGPRHGWWDLIGDIWDFFLRRLLTCPHKVVNIRKLLVQPLDFWKTLLLLDCFEIFSSWIYCIWVIF